MADEIYAGLDIGSNAVRVAVGKPVPAQGGKDQMHIIGAVEVPSSGISKGTVTNLEEAVSSVSRALEQAERVTGVPLSGAWVGISGSHIIPQESRGVIGVARGDGEIKDEDVERAIEAARTVATPTNYEIIHVIPKSFIVDGQRGIKDPVGMNGIRLEVDALIIEGLTSQIRTLTKCVYRTGLDIEDLVFSILATAEAARAAPQPGAVRGGGRAPHGRAPGGRGPCDLGHRDRPAHLDRGGRAGEAALRHVRERSREQEGGNRPVRPWRAGSRDREPPVRV